MPLSVHLITRTSPAWEIFPVTELVLAADLLRARSLGRGL